jgi:hypothetical protein
LLVVSLAWISCCTRISDNVHHWGDVVVGMGLGALVALWTVVCLVPAAAAAGKGADAEGGDGVDDDDGDNVSIKFSLKSCNDASESTTAESKSVNGGGGLKEVNGGGLKDPEAGKSVAAV